MNGGNMKAPTPQERWHPPMTEAQHAFLGLEDFINDARMGNPMGGRMADEHMRAIRAAIVPGAAIPDIYDRLLYAAHRLPMTNSMGKPGDFKTDAENAGCSIRLAMEILDKARGKEWGTV